MNAYISKGHRVHAMLFSAGGYRYGYCGISGDTFPTEAKVTCKTCLREIERRQAARQGKGE